ncbi:hypothetical protein HH214_18405 [Mucilaginibacter robiniae]|uniref:Uncharacterized protein n=1 Tax=Mucilaginibacter robiniae TaxID=2728022 RepID=A0A7L5E7C3_9SPHI|nr:hypothetical protein [Mucilaginibacter robiniae]QJD97704.1 hypothetical protein HH214_18405 [Mucilaginibacter robiniae]
MINHPIFILSAMNMGSFRSILLLTYVLTVTCVAKAQDDHQIFIGQKADVVQKLVADEVQGHYNAGGYLVKMSAHTIDYKGKPVTIVLCKENVLNGSINKGINLCINYFIAGDIVAYIATEYKNLSESEVKNGLLSAGNLTNVAGYYFEKDYQYYHHLVNTKEGLVVDEYRKTVLEQLPASVREQLKMISGKW